MLVTKEGSINCLQEDDMLFSRNSLKMSIGGVAQLKACGCCDTMLFFNKYQHNSILPVYSFNLDKNDMCLFSSDPALYTDKLDSLNCVQCVTNLNYLVLVVGLDMYNNTVMYSWNIKKDTVHKVLKEEKPLKIVNCCNNTVNETDKILHSVVSDIVVKYGCISRDNIKLVGVTNTNDCLLFGLNYEDYFYLVQIKYNVDKEVIKLTDDVVIKQYDMRAVATRWCTDRLTVTSLSYDVCNSRLIVSTVCNSETVMWSVDRLNKLETFTYLMTPVHNTVTTLDFISDYIRFIDKDTLLVVSDSFYYRVVKIEFTT